MQSLCGRKLCGAIETREMTGVKKFLLIMRKKQVEE